MLKGYPELCQWRYSPLPPFLIIGPLVFSWRNLQKGQEQWPALASQTWSPHSDLMGMVMCSSCGSDNVSHPGKKKGCNQVFGLVIDDPVQRNRFVVVSVVVSSLKGAWLRSGSNSEPKVVWTDPMSLNENLSKLLRPSREREPYRGERTYDYRQTWLGPLNLRI